MQWVLPPSELSYRGNDRSTSHFSRSLLNAFGHIHSVPATHPSARQRLRRDISQKSADNSSESKRRHAAGPSKSSGQLSLLPFQAWQRATNEVENCGRALPGSTPSAPLALGILLKQCQLPRFLEPLQWYATQ
jgi:hypothetical protein